MTTALVIGAGPAGLMAADVMAAAGLRVTIADAMPTVGRKFLMAGKSGLNLTKDEGSAAFLQAYDPLPPALHRALRAYGPPQVMDWAQSLGQEVFTGTSGRVFPRAMKASPLLRAWLVRLGGLSVTLHTRWHWQGRDGAASQFATPAGPMTLATDITVLAMGGASWARLGSDGRWAEHFPGQTAPFQPANMGFGVDWSPHMARHFGQPIKSVMLIAGGRQVRAEFVITKTGVEGGGIYAVSKALRQGATLTLDLMPDVPLATIRARLGAMPRKDSAANCLRKLGLDPAKIALMQEFGRPLPADLGPLIKGLPVRLLGPHPIDQAISTAGGLRFDALDGFMLRDRPGTFAAGEMLDWEGPTGGYLITACLATGRAAAMQALAFRAQNP
jgi:uncharacterized flavoprotein (TIGR03862 family)